MCEFCNLMPNEEGNDNIINSQTFGFFSAAAIEQAVQQAKKQHQKNEDNQQPTEEDGVKDDDSDGT